MDGRYYVPANQVHSQQYQERLATKEGDDHMFFWRAVFNAVYTSITLRKGFGIRVQTPADEVPVGGLGGVVDMDGIKDLVYSNNATEYEIASPKKHPWAVVPPCFKFIALVAFRTFWTNIVLHSR